MEGCLTPPADFRRPEIAVGLVVVAADAVAADAVAADAVAAEESVASKLASVPAEFLNLKTVRNVTKTNSVQFLF